MCDDSEQLATVLKQTDIDCIFQTFAVVVVVHVFFFVLFRDVLEQAAQHHKWRLEFLLTHPGLSVW